MNLFRYAKDLKDYSGGRNQFSSDENVVKDVLKLLNNKNEYQEFLNGEFV